MKASNMSKADFVMSIGLMIFGVVVLVMSIQMPRFEHLNVNPYSVPGIVPGFLGSIIALLGLILLVRSIMRGGYAININRETVAAFFADPSTKRFLLTLLVCLGYAFGVLDRIPYLAATILFIFVFVVVFEFQKGTPLFKQWRMLLMALLLAGIAGAAIWAVFRYLFLVNLPG